MDFSFVAFVGLLFVIILREIHRMNLDKSERERITKRIYKAWLSGRLSKTMWVQSPTYKDLERYMGEQKLNTLLREARVEIDTSTLGSRCLEHNGEHVYRWLDGVPVCTQDNYVIYADIESE